MFPIDILEQKCFLRVLCQELELKLNYQSQKERICVEFVVLVIKIIVRISLPESGELVAISNNNISKKSTCISVYSKICVWINLLKHYKNYKALNK